MTVETTTTDYLSWTRKTSEWYFFLWTFLVCLLMKSVEGDSINAKCLRTGRRSSAYVDSYFSCNVCGGGIQWIVNGDDAGRHRSSQEVGSVSFQTESRDSTILRYASILLSKRTKNESICMDAVFLVSQPEEEFYNSLPQVACRSPLHELEIPVQRPIQQFNQMNNGTVTLTHVLGQSNVVLSGNRQTYVTHIFLCSTNESAQFWRHNQQPAGGFNGIHFPGFNEFTLHSSDSSVSSQDAVLLVKRPQDLTSILLLTDVHSNGNFNVLCLSNTDYIRSELNDFYSRKESSLDTTSHPNDEISSGIPTEISYDKSTEMPSPFDKFTETSSSSDYSITYSTESSSKYGISIALIVSFFICISIIVIAVFISMICIFQSLYKLNKWKLKYTHSSFNIEDGHHESLPVKLKTIKKDSPKPNQSIDSIHEPINLSLQNSVIASQLQPIYLDHEGNSNSDSKPKMGKGAHNH